MKRLYHYTSIERLPMILADGALRVTESNLSMSREHAGPDVVWLTSDPDCAHGHGISKTIDGTDKTRIRITVELPNKDAHRWKQWAIERGIDRAWLATLTNAAAQHDGETGGAGTWWVTERPVTRSRWVSIIDRETGEELLTDTAAVS